MRSLLKRSEKKNVHGCPLVHNMRTLKGTLGVVWFGCRKGVYSVYRILNASPPALVVTLCDLSHTRL